MRRLTRQELLDSGAPIYNTNETADVKYVSVNAFERRFYTKLPAGLGLNRARLPAHYEQSGWPELRARIGSAFRSQTRNARKRFSHDRRLRHPVLDGIAQSEPTPRFPRTTGAIAEHSGDFSNEAASAAWWFSPGEVSELSEDGAVT